MSLTITFAQVLSFNPCVPRTEAAIRQFGRQPSLDEPIALVALIDAGLTTDDLCWILARTHRSLLTTWAADCAEHKIERAESLISAFESRRPNDTRPRNAIVAARRCVVKIRDGACAAELRRDAAYAAADAYAAAAADAAAYAAAYAAYAADADADADAKKEHRDWCRARLREYLNGERSSSGKAIA